MTNPSITLCIDVSDSMRQYGYLPFAITDAGTFVYIMQTGDSLGITSFSDNSAIVYPPGGTRVKVIGSVADQDAAKNALNGLKSKNMTNTRAGLTASQGMLAGAAAPTAIVLLSDGLWNVGGDPLAILPFNPPIPVYTILLGPSGNVQSLKDIATRTGGTWHTATKPTDLQAVYNEIVGQTQVASVAANQERDLPQFRFWSLSGSVPAGAPVATFAVSWSDPTATYTPVGPPAGNQVNVYLTDPSGNTPSLTPYAAGGGYVVFKVANPAAGTWQATIWSASPKVLGTTGGVFNVTTSNQLTVMVAQDASVGTPHEVAAVVRGPDGTPLADAVITASLEKPILSPQAAIAKHRERLDAIPLPADATEVSDNVRMLALQHELGTSETLLPYEHVPMPMARAANGTRAASFTPDTSGAHILWMTAIGTGPDGVPYSLRRRISIWADE